MNQELFDRLLNPLRRALRMQIRLATVTGSNYDGTIPVLQIAYDTDEDGEPQVRECMYFDMFGALARPSDGSLVLYAQIGASPRHLIALAVIETSIPVTLAKGERVVFAGGGYAHFRADGDVDIVAKSGKHVNLGAETPGDVVALGQKTDDEIDLIWNTLTGWTPAPPDGGAAFKTYATSQKLLKGSVKSSKVKAS